MSIVSYFSSNQISQFQNQNQTPENPFNPEPQMIKVPISDNYVMPSFQTVNKNPQQTQLILMDPQTTSLYLLHQYYCTDSEDYSDLIALLQTQAAQGIQSPYVLNPVVYLPIKYTNEDFQTSHFVQVLYEYGSHTLQQQLYLRIQQKNYFQEHQIWSILGSIVLGMKNLKDKQFTHSSICMGDIFVTRQGQIKICHPMFRTYDHKNSQQVEHHYLERAISENYYFAPEQLPTYHRQDRKFLTQKHSSSGSSFNQHSQSQSHNQQLHVHNEMTLDDIFKSDIFSTGMTVISLCMLYPINDCYTKIATNKSYQIHIESDRLAQYFNALEQTYSQDLLGLLFSMVAYNSEERISIDQLAMIIQQMIQAKQEEEQLGNQQDQQTQSNAFTDKIFEQDAKGSIIRKNHNTQSDNNITSEEKFGKFSRVSQASPLSGRKTPRATHTYGASLQHTHPDPQDKPSIVSIQCQIDYPNVDIEEYNTLNQSQANIDCQMDDNNTESYHTQQQIHKPIQQHKAYTQPHTQPQLHQQTTQSINQTLKQYINNQMSSILQVNQTKTFEQNQRKSKEQKNPFSPQYVQSVMTSKELCSLPSDSTSFVVQKHVIGKDNYVNFGNTLNHAKLIHSKEMQSQRKHIHNELTSKNNQFILYQQQQSQFILRNNNQQQLNDKQVKSRSPSSLKQFLNTIKQHNNQAPKAYQILNQYPLNGISSARTYSEQTKQNHHIGANQYTNITQQTSYSNVHSGNTNKVSSNNMMGTSLKSSVNVSLNKEYQNFMEIQRKNPSSLYTDPEFLRAIREDVNKILNKRKNKLPTKATTETHISQQPSSNHIFINSKKVDNLRPQHMTSYITPISYMARPYPPSGISQFR